MIFWTHKTPHSSPSQVSYEVSTVYCEYGVETRPVSWLDWSILDWFDSGDADIQNVRVVMMPTLSSLWHHRLSLWQPMVLPMMTTLASWQLLDFQWTVSSINTFIGNRKVGIRSLLFSGITVSCNIASLSPGDVLWSRVMTICMWSLQWLCSEYMLLGPNTMQCSLTSIEKLMVEIRHLKDHHISTMAFLAATKQLYEWYFPSVRPSVCPSVCPSVRLSVRHTFLTMFPSSYHHEIFRSYYQWQKWRPCKRSRSEIKGQGHRGHNPT